MTAEITTIDIVKKYCLCVISIIDHWLNNRMSILSDISYNQNDDND